MTYLLDTSAWIAHIFRAPGWERLNELFAENSVRIEISVLSLAELQGRLKAAGCDSQFETFCEAYRPMFDAIVPIDESIVRRAVALKRESTGRLPGFHALIAATASLRDAVLIHRDAHFQSIPPNWLTQAPLLVQS